MPLSATIRHLRSQRGYTQAELASLIGVDRSAVAQWENGLSQPRMGNVSRLAEIFDTRVSVLLEGEPTRTDSPFVRPLIPLLAPNAAVGWKDAPGDTPPQDALTYIEVPPSLLERHPNAAAILVEDDRMDRIVPEGLAAVFDPNLAPGNGSLVLVALGEGHVLMRRWYRGASTILLVADSHAPCDDIVIRADDDPRVLGTIVWVQSPTDMTS